MLNLKFFLANIVKIGQAEQEGPFWTIKEKK